MTAVKRPYTVKIVTTDAGSHLQLVSGNGEIVMSSENFSKHANARRAARHLAEASDVGFNVVDETGKRISTALERSVARVKV